MGDVGALGLWLDVNGVRRQSGSTAKMLFDPIFIVRYLSQFMVLEPGDLINTGTPAGVGMGRTPPVYLRPGDRMDLGTDGLGRQSQAVVAAP
jgi:2-keto-4-pentenoate hydratase/2-oxohepta-3-ene-1,7-dioic acid hydratase in catechol pathway